MLPHALRYNPRVVCCVIFQNINVHEPKKFQIWLQDKWELTLKTSAEFGGSAQEVEQISRCRQ